MKYALPPTPGSNPRNPRIVSIQGKFGSGWIAVEAKSGRVLDGPRTHPFGLCAKWPSHRAAGVAECR